MVHLSAVAGQGVMQISQTPFGSQKHCAPLMLHSVPSGFGCTKARLSSQVAFKFERRWGKLNDCSLHEMSNGDVCGTRQLAVLGRVRDLLAVLAKK